MRHPLLLAAFAAVPTALAAAQATLTRVSVDSFGVEGDRRSTAAAISANGRFVAFHSNATNLVANDRNGASDVFVHDRTNGQTVRVSVGPGGVEGNGPSRHPALSADGRFVVYESEAANLVLGDTNFVPDVFLHDRSTGATRRISVSSSGAQGNRRSEFPVITPDGRWVVFQSDASNLVGGDVNGLVDVFRHDTTTGTTELVSLAHNGVQGDNLAIRPSVSADGRFVAFESYATNLVPNDLNATQDVFVRDLLMQRTIRVSVDSQGLEADGLSDRPSISADGTLVAFSSAGSNLVPNDGNGVADVFLHDLLTAATTRVSVSTGGVEGDGASRSPHLEPGGASIAFDSAATNLVPNDVNGARDVFVRDLLRGTTDRVSLAHTGGGGNGDSVTARIALDEFVVFESAANDLVPNDSNGRVDVFLARWCPARSRVYGAGLAGTLGIPPIGLSAPPALGASSSIDVGSSFPGTTPGVLLLGVATLNLPLLGGTLHLLPDAVLSIPVPSTGVSVFFSVPTGAFLLCRSAYAQAVLVDPGAPQGFAFTPGLELRFGT